MTRPALCRFLRFATLALGMTGSLALAGCAASGNQSGDDEAAAATATREPPLNLRAGVPPTAVEEVTGTNSLDYTAEEMGTLYLYDRNANQMIGQVHVEPGQRLLVSGEAGRATLGGNELATSGSIRRGRTYTVYLLPTGQGEQPAQSSGQGFRIVPDNGDRTRNN